MHGPDYRRAGFSRNAKEFWATMRHDGLCEPQDIASRFGRW
jgi:hypothetical protein